jgi:hypothetical protein
LRNVGLPYARLAVPSMNMRCEFIDDGMLAWRFNISIQLLLFIVHHLALCNLCCLCTINDILCLYLGNIVHKTKHVY